MNDNKKKGIEGLKSNIQATNPHVHEFVFAQSWIYYYNECKLLDIMEGRLPYDDMTLDIFQIAKRYNIRLPSEQHEFYFECACQLRYLNKFSEEFSQKYQEKIPRLRSFCT